MGKVSDGLGLAFELCRGTFADEASQVTTLATDAETSSTDCRFSQTGGIWMILPYFMEKGRDAPIYSKPMGRLSP
jgi:hypothetical protein